MSIVYEAFDLNDRTITGKVLTDFTVDFCKTMVGVDVSQSGMTLTELGAGRYILMNPNITARTIISLYLTADSSISASVMMDPVDGDVAQQSTLVGVFGSTSGSVVTVEANLSSICSEALQKAGYSTGTSQYATLLTRARVYWSEEVKNDIFGLAKRPTYLQKTAIISLTANKARYSFPSDFSTPISATLLSASVSGTAVTGGTSSITLAVADTMTKSYAEGKEVVITGGTGVNQARQIISFNITTKVATVDMAWDTLPSTDSTYMIAESYDPLKEEPVWFYDSFTSERSIGTPYAYFPEGDKQSSQTSTTYTGGFSLADTPDSTYSYAIKLRYYVDLLKVNLDSSADPTIAVLYTRWRNVFVQGIYCKALQNQDDTRYAGEFGVYDKLLKTVQARETYGVDLNDLRMRVDN